VITIVIDTVTHTQLVRTNRTALSLDLNGIVAPIIMIALNSIAGDISTFAHACSTTIVFHPNIAISVVLIVVRQANGFGFFHWTYFLALNGQRFARIAHSALVLIESPFGTIADRFLIEALVARTTATGQSIAPFHLHDHFVTDGKVILTRWTRKGFVYTIWVNNGHSCNQ